MTVRNECKKESLDLKGATNSVTRLQFLLSLTPNGYCFFNTKICMQCPAEGIIYLTKTGHRLKTTEDFQCSPSIVAGVLTEASGIALVLAC